MSRASQTARASEPSPPVDRRARGLAAASLTLALLALVLAGWALSMQQASEARLRDLGRELERSLAPAALPSLGPPPRLDPDDT